MLPPTNQMDNRELSTSIYFNRVLKNVMSAGKARQNPTKKRSLCVKNGHFEEDFNAV
jgi:hypothetical protein